MTQFKFKAVAALLWTFVFTAQAQTDLTFINIDKIGFSKLQEIKEHPKVEWWVEMGEHLVVATNEQKINFPKFVEIMATQKQVDLSTLAFESAGHCGHSEGQEKAHSNIRGIFDGTSFKMVSTDGLVNKSALIDHKKFIPFEKNKVLSYQIENRDMKRSVSVDLRVKNLVDQVDQDRWFEQVEYLASLDRLEDRDLIIAGNWLKDKFDDLGLQTSTMDPNNRPGFNVLGFKQGTTRADEWYVVGAHLDSRNQLYDDNQPSPGAEDNASGCSGVLEIANVLSQYETEASILFICFNSEERGLLGSQDVINVMQQNGDFSKVKTMFNMDMIGYQLAGKYTALAGTTGGEYADLVENMATNGSLYTDLDWQVSTNKCCTDYVSFLEAGVPAMTTSEPHLGWYFAYHSTRDLPRNIDPKMGAGIVKANVATLAQLTGVSYPEVNYEITPAQSGLWFNVDQSGHGLSIEVLENNLMVVYWYVFDNMGNQIWLIGAGQYDGNEVTIEVSKSEMGLFPPNFVASDVVSEVWGNLQLTFNDCNSLAFSWQPVDDNGYEAGSMSMSRLTSIAGVSCE